MTQLLNATISGLGLGSVYALLALGFVIIYKSMAVISFAQPAFMLSGAILVSYLSPEIGFAAGVVVGTGAIAAAALVVERIAIRPMVGKAVFAIAIITIGIVDVLDFSTAAVPEASATMTSGRRAMSSSARAGMRARLVP